VPSVRAVVNPVVYVSSQRTETGRSGPAQHPPQGEKFPLRQGHERAKLRMTGKISQHPKRTTPKDSGP